MASTPPLSTLIKQPRSFSLVSSLFLLIIFVITPSRSIVVSSTTTSTCEEGNGESHCSSSVTLVVPPTNSQIDNSDNNNMLYSIILPTYNERDNLPLITQFIHDTFTSAKLNYEIIIVDDSSPDGTLDVAKQLQTIFTTNTSTTNNSKSNNNIHIVSRPGKLGLGSAYSAGLKVSSGNRIVLMDADMSHHPKYIIDMIATMNEKKVDIVSGTRYKRGGGVAGWDTKRKLTSCGANFLATFLLSTGGASDLTGSFRLYDRKALEQTLPLVKSKGYAFQMEILIRANKGGLIIDEVPIVFVDRIYGESKLGANEIIMYLKGLINLFLTT
jgi:dolichol-phosphate mannosyltransferase